MLTIVKYSTIDADTIYPFVRQLNETMSFTTCARHLKHMLEQGYFLFAAYEEDTLVGLTGCWVGTKFYCGKYLELDNFVVDAEHRGAGVGDALMQHALAHARALQCDCVVLNAYEWNAAAHAFYDRYGFDSPGKHRILWLREDATTPAA